MTAKTSPRLALHAETAADLMSENPVSLRRDATVAEALALLLDRDISAAPVIDDAGRPLGVVSATDIMVHEREASLPAGVRAQLAAPGRLSRRLNRDAQFEYADPTTVEELMTPSVFAVPLHATAAEVVAAMLRAQAHRLFVEDEFGTLVGAISTTDILRKLGA